MGRLIARWLTGKIPLARKSVRMLEGLIAPENAGGRDGAIRAILSGDASQIADFLDEDVAESTVRNLASHFKSETKKALADQTQMTLYRGGYPRPSVHEVAPQGAREAFSSDLVGFSKNRDTAQRYAAQRGEPLFEVTVPVDAVIADVEQLLPSKFGFGESEVLVDGAFIRQMLRR